MTILSELIRFFSQVEILVIGINENLHYQTIELRADLLTKDTGFPFAAILQ